MNLHKRIGYASLIGLCLGRGVLFGPCILERASVDTWPRTTDSRSQIGESRPFIVEASDATCAPIATYRHQAHSPVSLQVFPLTCDT